MRVLGIDYGDKRIGVAISDPLGITAQPVSVIKRSQSFRDDFLELKKIIENYSGVDAIVVGLPKTMQGEIGIAAQKVLKFVEMLKKESGLEVVTWDERLTTAEAERMLISAGLSRAKRKQVIDKSAATYILQGYLDCRQK